MKVATKAVIDRRALPLCPWGKVKYQLLPGEFSQKVVNVDPQFAAEHVKQIGSEGVHAKQLTRGQLQVLHALQSTDIPGGVLRGQWSVAQATHKQSALQRGALRKSFHVRSLP